MKPLRLFGKKKGSRITGSLRRAGAAEILIPAALFLVGLVMLTSLVTLQLQGSTTDQWRIGLIPFSLQVLVAILLMVIGGYRVTRTWWKLITSVERRGAIAVRAREINLLNEVRTAHEHLPNVPMNWQERLGPGAELKYRLAPKPMVRWRLSLVGTVWIAFVAAATVLTVVFLQSIQAGQLDWLTLMLALIMIAASVWATVLVARYLLSHTGIGPTRLEISEFPLRVDQTYRVYLLQPARVRLRLLDVSMQCVEEATYREGTDVRTETRVVYQQRLFRKRGQDVRPAEPYVAEFSLATPRHAMHSFSSANNRINWRIVVQCTSIGWPRFERVFPLILLPPKRQVSA